MWKFGIEKKTCVNRSRGEPPKFVNLEQRPPVLPGKKIIGNPIRSEILALSSKPSSSWLCFAYISRRENIVNPYQVSKPPELRWPAEPHGRSLPRWAVHWILIYENNNQDKKDGGAFHESGLNAEQVWLKARYGITAFCIPKTDSTKYPEESSSCLNCRSKVKLIFIKSSSTLL